MSNVNWYPLIVLPLMVFFARIADVSLGTLRIIFTSRGRRKIAPFLGFVEVFIWIVVVSQVVKNVHSLPAYFGYAAGFAVGTYVGMKIEERLALGTLVLRIILSREGENLAERLRAAGYGVTVVNGMGSEGDVKLLYTVIQRRNLEMVVEIIKSVSTKAFFSVEELRSSESGIFHSQQGKHTAFDSVDRSAVLSGKDSQMLRFILKALILVSLLLLIPCCSRTGAGSEIDRFA